LFVGVGNIQNGCIFASQSNFYILQPAPAGVTSIGTRYKRLLFCVYRSAIR